MTIMPKKPGRYESIAEVRSSLYPSSASILGLEKNELLDFPSSLADKSRQIREGVGKGGSDAEGAEAELEEPDVDEP